MLQTVFQHQNSVWHKACAAVRALRTLRWYQNCLMPLPVNNGDSFFSDFAMTRPSTPSCLHAKEPSTNIASEVFVSATTRYVHWLAFENCIRHCHALFPLLQCVAGVEMTHCPRSFAPSATASPSERISTV